MTSRLDRARVEAAVRELLAAIGEDPDRPGLARTPARVAEAYAEFFHGLDLDAEEIARSGVVAADEGERGELVVVRDIRFRSVCEHHLLPFEGVAHIAYAPGSSLIGLGTLSRVIDAVASRPQLQERLGEESAATIARGLDARGVLVVLDARHQCVTARGERQTGSTTLTVAATGSLAEPERRAEALALIAAGTGRPVADPAADATGPDTTGPAATGPAATGPAATGPAATGPAVAGPAATGPAVAGPGAGHDFGRDHGTDA